MIKVFVRILCILSVMLICSCSHWNELNNKQKGAWIGVGSGAIVGSALGGVFGTVIGGVSGGLAGGVIGSETGKGR